MLEQGIQAPSPAPDLIPAETSTETLHRDWNYERGHIRSRNPSVRHEKFRGRGCEIGAEGRDAIRLVEMGGVARGCGRVRAVVEK